MSMNDLLENIYSEVSSLFSMAYDEKLMLRQRLEKVMESMSLVSRQEFDAQQQILQRTREKVQELESRLSEIENPPSR